MDSAGNLYGTTADGGQISIDGVFEFGDGTIFELPHGSSTISTLFTFDGTDGGLPGGFLTLDSAGNLYGTTSDGGASEDGTVFELPSGSTAITTLFSFSGSNGQYPKANVIFDSAGNLYGTTVDGGTSDFGTVFELTPLELETVSPASPTLTTTPGGTVVLGSGGGLSDSATLAGGYNPTGTITFTLVAPNGTTVVQTETVTVSGDGTYSTPTGVVPTAIGTYQWFVRYSGDSNNIPVSAVSANPSLLTTSFTGTNGSTPDAGVILDSAGNLYGTTEDGGTSSDGTIFELAKESSTITVLASFDDTDGANPIGALVMDSTGNLYGTTITGECVGRRHGVFEFAKGSSTITVLASFDGTDGSEPHRP